MVNEVAIYTLLGLNTFAAMGGAYATWREHRSATRARSDLNLAHAANEAAHLENLQAKGEISQLKAQLRASNSAAALLGKRNKLLAVELRGSDGTAKTCVWPQAKPEVFMRTDLQTPNGESDPWL